MRDYLEIVRRNFLSPIVLAIFLLAGALVFVREYRDAWFISVVIVVNSLIGVVQEIRAKRVLKKLELMSAPRARVERDGELVDLPYDALRLDDVLHVRAGDEIPGDGIVTKSRGLELNESLLTGESAAVEKRTKDAVFAATTVTAGAGVIRIEALGDDTKAGTISAALKRYTPQLTPLQRAIQRAITWLTYGAVAQATIIFVIYFLSGRDSVQILKTITAAAVTVVPEGLLLASSLLLAFGSLRLAQAKVLPQKLSAIEAMALLGVLCVDKTGTLTSDEVTVESVISFADNNQNIGDLAALVARETSGENSTGRAILAEFEVGDSWTVDEVLAFSSARKLSAVRAKDDSGSQTIMMGAPEFVAAFAPLSKSQQRQIDSLANEGLRVLLLAKFDDLETPLKKLAPKSGRALGLVVLRNSLRDGVAKTVDFLQSQGVRIRVISGDNPCTVQFIARAAGITDSENSITGAELAGLNDEEFARAADKHTIFARVLPEQKERLIAHFSDSGKFTGMVGDGMNDALALKKADLGIAMYAGAPAALRVADLILLNNSFTSLPLGMRLGNRIMQAIEVIATLFFHKIIYGVVLLLCILAIGLVYPFAPRHITFMNIFLVTLPTLMWTIFPPEPRHKINPHNFWRDTLVTVLPIAILTGMAVAFTYWIGLTAFPRQASEVSTMTVLTATFFGVYLVFLVGPMLGVRLTASAKRARIIYLLAAIFVAVSSFGIGFLRNFFDFTMPNILVIWPASFVSLLVAALQWYLAKKAGRRLIKSSNATQSD